MIYHIYFSHNYNKLRDKIFTTIRRYDKTYYKEGKTILIKSPRLQFKAIIIMKIKKSITEIPLEFILQDTEKNNYIDAMKLFNSFYKQEIQPNEKLTILILKRCK